jgi:hypothetical protein
LSSLSVSDEDKNVFKLGRKFDHSASHIESMTPQKWIEHGRIVANIAKLVGDPIIYKILLLLTLTKPPYGAIQVRVFCAMEQRALKM